MKEQPPKVQDEMHLFLVVQSMLFGKLAWMMRAFMSGNYELNQANGYGCPFVRQGWLVAKIQNLNERSKGKVQDRVGFAY